MRPSRQLLSLLTGWLALGLLAAVSGIREWPNDTFIELLFWTGGIVLALVSVRDAAAARAPVSLDVERAVPEHLALGVRQRIDIRVSNTTAQTRQISITDSTPPQLSVIGLPQHFTLSPDEHAQISYTVVPIARGPAVFDPVCCRIQSPLGLWENTFKFLDAQTSKVYPNYKPLIKSSLINNSDMYANLGVHVRQRRGDGTDFRQLRDFRIGDSLSQIDWRATARFHRPISREYQEERDQNVLFLLDCGRRMRARDGDISHFDHSLNAMLLTAFVALRQGDSVGLLSFAGQSRWTPPLKGRQQINCLLNQIYDLDSTLASSDYLDVAQQLLSRQSKRALIVLISTVEPEDHDDLVAATRLLSQRHLVLVACLRPQALDQARQEEVGGLDSALRFCGASAQLSRRQTMLTALRSNSVIVADTPPVTMHTALIDEYISLKRRGVF